MKIIVCLNNDIMSNLAFNMLYPSISKHQIEIFMTDTVGKPAKKIQEISLLEQSIPCDILFPLIEKSGEPDNNSYFTFSQFEKYNDIKISKPSNVNNPEIIQYIKKFSPDLIVSIRFGQIFRSDVISIPKHGILNLHSGILPDYKGILCTLQAILHGEKQVGTTLHYIEDRTIDTGSIIGMSKIDVQHDKSLLWHVMNIYDGGIQMLSDNIKKIENSIEIKSTNQDLTEGKYFSNPSREDIVKLLNMGFSIVDEETYKAMLSMYINDN